MYIINYILNIAHETSESVYFFLVVRNCSINFIFQQKSDKMFATLNAIIYKDFFLTYQWRLNPH